MDAERVDNNQQHAPYWVQRAGGSKTYSCQKHRRLRYSGVTVFFSPANLSSTICNRATDQSPRCCKSFSFLLKVSCSALLYLTPFELPAVQRRRGQRMPVELSSQRLGYPTAGHRILLEMLESAPLWCWLSLWQQRVQVSQLSTLDLLSIANRNRMNNAKRNEQQQVASRSIEGLHDILRMYTVYTLYSIGILSDSRLGNVTCLQFNLVKCTTQMKTP